MSRFIGFHFKKERIYDSWDMKGFVTMTTFLQEKSKESWASLFSLEINFSVPFTFLAR